MMKLVRVDLSNDTIVYFPDCRFTVEAIQPAQADTKPGRHGDLNEVFYRTGEFFKVDERDVDIVVRHLTTTHPGREVQVFDLCEVSIRPAGEMVKKKVTKDGILPS